MWDSLVRPGASFKNLIEKSYMRMLFQAKAVPWDLIKAENPRYLHEVSNHSLLYFITITPVRVIAEI